MMTITCFPASLRVDSHANALVFYERIKNTLLIDAGPGWKLRIEPGNHISLVSVSDIRAGLAPLIPSLKDDDGRIAYRYRKYINAYLRE